jgi:hypothetical protein
VIKIFLASSSELQQDRKDFELLISRKNQDWARKGIFLDLNLWENFLDAMSQTRLQNEYNKVIRECDIFVMLFSTKVGQYTEEEFETAFGQFKAINKPLIFTYFKDIEVRIASVSRTDIKSFWDFQDKLDQLGHFCTVYKNIDDLKFQFNQQLDKLEASGAFTQRVGNRVLALWVADNHWYSGTVTKIARKRFQIKFDDGVYQWLGEEEVIPLEYECKVNDPTECRWRSRKGYYPAHIIEINGEDITVQYESEVSAGGPSAGEKEKTNIKFLRFSR